MLKALPALLAVLFLTAPAFANVADVSDRTFVIRHTAEVPLSAPAVWELLIRPDRWWSSAHTVSADAANLSLEPKAGGCFCEILPDAQTPNSPPAGSVEHMRVIHIERDRVLRLSGGLGPLQSDAVVGTLTFQLRPTADGTQILLEYVVSGFMRTPAPQLAPLVDVVLGEQLARLAERLEGELIDAPRSGPVTTMPVEKPEVQMNNAIRPAPALRRDPPSILPVDPDAAAGSTETNEPDQIVEG